MASPSVQLELIRQRECDQAKTRTRPLDLSNFTLFGGGGSLAVARRLLEWLFILVVPLAGDEHAACPFLLSPLLVSSIGPIVNVVAKAQSFASPRTKLLRKTDDDDNNQTPTRNHEATSASWSPTLARLIVPSTSGPVGGARFRLFQQAFIHKHSRRQSASHEAPPDLSRAAREFRVG